MYTYKYILQLLTIYVSLKCSIFDHSHMKKIVWEYCNFFCLCYTASLTSAHTLRKRTKSSGNFNDIKFKHKVWKKYINGNLDYVSRYPKAFLNEMVMNEGNWFIFHCSNSKKKMWCIFLKYLRETMSGFLNGGKTLRESILKNISVCQYIFLKITYKSMYKIITPLFLQKSLEAYRNSGIQQN